MKWYHRIDWILIACWVMLTVAGLVAIYSATQGPVAEYLPDHIQRNFANQLTWFFISIVVLIGVQFTAPRTFQQVSYLFYIICLILAVVTIFWGVEVSGAKRWFVLGGIRFQISELLKLATILAVANYLTSRRNISAERIGTALMAVVLMAIPSVLIILQNDTGTALVLIAIIPIMLFWSGVPYGISLLMISPPIVTYFSILGWFWGILAVVVLTLIIFAVQRRPWMIVASAAMGGLVVVGVQMFMYRILQPYQQQRIEAFTNPTMDPQGAGWNVMQAKTAIGSGGLTGQGFMEGTQTQLRFLPEQWTDFIFPVIAEEFGFIGASIVLLLFGILLMRLLNSAIEHKNPFAQLVLVGVATIFFMHVLINIGSATGLFPVIGLPLPFLSYGGSAFLANTLMLAVCLNLKVYQREMSIHN